MYKVERDGDKWVATGPGFKNLQESVVGHGDSAFEAFAALIVEMHKTKMTVPLAKAVLNADNEYVTKAKAVLQEAGVGNPESVLTNLFKE